MKSNEDEIQYQDMKITEKGEKGIRGKGDKGKRGKGKG